MGEGRPLRKLLNQVFWASIYSLIRAHVEKDQEKTSGEGQNSRIGPRLWPIRRSAQKISEPFSRRAPRLLNAHRHRPLLNARGPWTLALGPSRDFSLAVRMG
jgi:hypothetical protein